MRIFELKKEEVGSWLTFISNIVDDRLVLSSPGLVCNNYNCSKSEPCKFSLKLIDMSSGDIEIVEFFINRPEISMQWWLECSSKLDEIAKVIKREKEHDRIKSVIEFLYEKEISESIVKYLIRETNFCTKIKLRVKDKTNLMDYRDKLKEEFAYVEHMISDIESLSLFISSKIDVIPYRVTGNTNMKTFDGFHVRVYLIGKGQGLTLQDIVEKFKRYKHDIDLIVVNKIVNSREFKKYKVPVNILKLDKVQITRDFMAIYTFSIKDIKSDTNK